MAKKSEQEKRFHKYRIMKESVEYYYPQQYHEYNMGYHFVNDVLFYIWDWDFIAFVSTIQSWKIQIEKRILKKEYKNEEEKEYLIEYKNELENQLKPIIKDRNLIYDKIDRVYEGMQRISLMMKLGNA